MEFDFDKIGFIPSILKPWMPLIVGIVIAIVIVVIGFMVAGMIAGVVAKMMRKRKVDESLVSFLTSLVRWMVIAVAVIAALGRVGIQTGSLVALLGTAGLAVGLALQGNLSHFASGVMILLFRPFTIDHVISCAGHTGGVSEIGLFTTTLVTPDNETIIIPNGAVIGGPIVNYTTRGSRRAHIDVGVAYGTKITDVLPVLEKAAKRCDLVKKDPGATVAFVGLGASSLDFTVLVHCVATDYAGVLHQVRTAVYEELEAAGIEIPFNQIVVHQASAA